MRKNLSLLLIISFVMVSSLSAQKKKNRFESVNQFAIVGGENHMNTAFQTINGIKFSDWLAGIGIGIDYYRYKTLPLFADARWHFGEDKKAFFYGDLGYNFPMKDKPGKEVYYYNTYDFIGGIYTDFGIGFQLSLNKYSSLIFSLGHSYKKLQNKIGIKTSCPIGTCPVDYSQYDYKFGRMILKAGLLF